MSDRVIIPLPGIGTLEFETSGADARGFVWQLDRRSKAVREVAADLVELWQFLGGHESLSTQRRILVERVVFIRRRVLEFESAAIAGKPLTFEYGVYSNLANVLVGYLRPLGPDRKARTVRSLREVMSGTA
jgi:hypothetical protein